MSANYMPAGLNAFAAWLSNFETVGAVTPTAIGTVAGDWTALGVLSSAFYNALAVSQAPETRTPVTVAETNTAFLAARAGAQTLAMKIQGYPPLTNGQRASLGLTQISGTRTPIPTPTDQPVAAVNRLLPLEIELRVKSLALDSARLPIGSIGYQVYRKIAETAPVSIDDCDYRGVTGRRFYNDTFDGADAGKSVFYLLRYVTRTGLTGPTSAMLATTIPG